MTNPTDLSALTASWTDREIDLLADAQFYAVAAASGTAQQKVTAAANLRDTAHACTTPGTITIPTPTIATGPVGVTPAAAAADYLHAMRSRVRRLQAGSGVTALVDRLLADVVAALDEATARTGPARPAPEADL